MLQSREDVLCSAILAEQAERYEEMVEYVKEFIRSSEEADLTPQERNLLSVAYKNVIGVRRGSWRILSNIEAKEELKLGVLQNGNAEQLSKKLQQAKSLRQQVEKEMRDICTDIISLLDKTLIPNAKTGESEVFYCKMKGDYYRYLAEFSAEGGRKEFGDRAHEAYKKAMDIASSHLAPTHPVRLGLALNFSVFYYEIMQSTDRACRLSKTAFDDAIAELDNLNEESYKDSTLIMQLLRDNLTLWSSEILPDEKEPNGDPID